MCAFGQAKLLQLSGNLQVLSEDVFIQLLTDIQGFNAEIPPRAPCGSEGESTARGERLKGEGSVLIVHPHPHFSIQQGHRGGPGPEKIFRISIKL